MLTEGWRDADFFFKERGGVASPAFAWYAEKVSAAVAAVDGPVLLLGHSAGGWLAKLACLADDDVATRCAAIVSLGAPHAPPPAGVPCATRGVVASVFAAPWPDAFDGAIVTVASDSVRGDAASSDGERATAADAYRRVTGNAADVGDSVVPLAAAHLPEADARLTLACKHSINVAGSGVPTDDWYGAEKWIDAWLGPALEQVRRPRWLREAGRRVFPAGITN